MSQGDPKPRAMSLAWLPQSAAEEWQSELDALCGLRLMLAGLALRHALDADNGAVINPGLNADIAAAQALLQQAIARCAENAGALRDLARVVKDETPIKPDEETLH